MPAYNTDPVRALYPGESIALVNDASVDTGISTTQQFAVGPNPIQGSNVVNFINTTNHDAQGQIAEKDVAASYANASGLVVSAGTALPWNMADGWVRFTFASSPTSGSLVAAR